MADCLSIPAYKEVFGSKAATSGDSYPNVLRCGMVDSIYEQAVSSENTITVKELLKQGSIQMVDDAKDFPQLEERFNANSEN